jgi:hypothetical protein
MTVASSTLCLRPRDMTQIRQMYLDTELWKGTRVVSDRCVGRSTRESMWMVASQSLVPDFSACYVYLC